MSWIMAGMAVVGLLKGNKNVKKEAENDKYRKMAVAMAPWTGAGDPGALNLPGPLESAAGGAAMGGQMGGMLGKMGGGAAPQAAAAQASPEQAYSQMQQGMGMEQSAMPQLSAPQQQGMMGSPGALGPKYRYSLIG